MDPIVKQVTDLYHSRSEVGMRKYGTNLTRTDLKLFDWLTHLQEELMDATLYIQRLKDEIDNYPVEIQRKFKKD